MEKVKITKVSDSGKVFGNEKKPLFTIELSDGRIGMSTDANFKEQQGKEIEIEIRNGAEYNGVKPVYFNLPASLRTELKPSSVPNKDWTLQKRITALECSTRIHAGGLVDCVEIMTTAESFYDWLNKK